MENESVYGGTVLFTNLTAADLAELRAVSPRETSWRDFRFVVRDWVN